MKLSNRLLFASLFAGTALAQDPPCQVGMVVKAGSLNYNAKILEFISSSGLYKVQYVTGHPGEAAFVPPAGLKTCQAPPIAPVPLSWFQGVWQTFKGGGGAWAKNATSGSWKVVALDVAAGPPIRFNADGTYEWIVDQSQTLRGVWRAAAPGDLKYGYVNQYNCKGCGDRRGTVALLEKGEYGGNWLHSRVLTDTADGAALASSLGAASPTWADPPVRAGVACYWSLGMNEIIFPADTELELQTLVEDAARFHFDDGETPSSFG